MNEYYVYALLDPRKHGNFVYEKYVFEYEPFYIGKGKGKRFLCHFCKSSLSHKTRKNSKIKSILHNMRPITYILLENLSEEESYREEAKTINIIGRLDENSGPLTNNNFGGIGVMSGMKHTDEAKRKISLHNAKHNLGKHLSEETRKKISDSKSILYRSGGFIHPLLGTKWSNETREKILCVRKTKPIVWSKIQKENLKKIRCKNKNKSQTQYWEVTSPEGKVEIVYGLGEFCRDNNLRQAHMFSVSTGERKHHKGWLCKKINEINLPSYQEEPQSTPILLL